MRTLRNTMLTTVMGNLALGLCVAQEPAIIPAIPQARPPSVRMLGEPPPEAESEKRLDLDFKGGTPRQLVDAIEKALKAPLNVIIPEEHAGFTLPPLKLRNVTVPQLFQAISVVNTRLEMHQNSLQHNAYGQYSIGYGFKTADQRAPASANSIWHFYVNSPPAKVNRSPELRCRFWNLEPYLDKLKVEDITTAIETGWKMLIKGASPQMKFHKDTKLLVVVGEQDQLLIVDDVLRELRPGAKDAKDKSRPTAAPALRESE